MTETTGENPNGAAPPADPLPPATLNLDTLEREGKVPEPFTFQHNQRVYTLTDPREIDWQDLITALTNPFVFFKVTLPDADQAAFFGTKMSSFKLNKLIDAYIAHHGLPPLGESDALPR